VGERKREIDMWEMGLQTVGETQREREREERE
jgi:hypothetical protein